MSIARIGNCRRGHAAAPGLPGGCEAKRGEGAANEQKRCAEAFRGLVADGAGGGKTGEYALSILAALLGVACSLAPYFIMIRIITGLVNGTAELSRCLTLCLWMAGFWALRYVLHSISTTISNHATFHVLAKTRIRLMDKLALLFSVDWRMGLSMLIVVPLGGAALMSMFHDYEKNFQRAVASTKALNDTAVEYISGIEVIKAFGQSKTSYAKFVSAAKEGPTALSTGCAAICSASRRAWRSSPPRCWGCCRWAACCI